QIKFQDSGNSQCSHMKTRDLTCSISHVFIELTRNCLESFAVVHVRIEYGNIKRLYYAVLSKPTQTQAIKKFVSVRQMRRYVSKELTNNFI
ncbi:hypothetical protein V3C99_018293, partial [Haemonchus contortus]|uniref:Ras-associating domain-containing protein n=1 Tax=Haemonchus contortus TaxID=6289 RepID=A0A7I4Z313_HAECO